MSRPVGVKNKPKALLLKPVVAPDVILNVTQPIHYDAIFGVRNLRNGQFKGLWELVKLDNNGRRQVLTDANSRGMILRLVSQAIMKIVVQS